MDFSGKTALVTGGGRGIGRAICVKLASLGANVLINYAGNDAEAEITKKLCLEACRTAKAETFKCDVSDFGACGEMFDRCAELLGEPYFVINNAGITRDNLLLKMTEEDFRRVIDVNLGGAFNCIKHAYRALTKKRGGRIVSISSVVGINGNAGQANYAASKAGIIGLTKSAAKELARRNVTVNAVAPGFIESDMTGAIPEESRRELLTRIPLGRAGQAEEIAETVAFLCSDAGAYITGQVITVDGGMSM